MSSILRRILLTSSVPLDWAILYTASDIVTPTGIPVFSNLKGKDDVWILKPRKQLSKIPSSAFASTSITTIKIPEEVENLEGSCFESCTSLDTVTLPSTIKNIDNNAFRYTNVSKVYFNGDIEDYLKISFANISSNPLYSKGGVLEMKNGPVTRLLLISHSDNVVVPSNAFVGCSSLQEVNISAGGYCNITANAFRNSSNLTNVELASTNIYIGNNAFENSGITSLNIPDYYISPDNIPKVTIGEYAFMNCKNLTIRALTWLTNITKISKSSFYGCKNLTTIHLNYDVPSDAFHGCTSLREVTLTTNCTIIANGAFENCISLPSVTIPNSVTSIGAGAFEGCSSLTNVTIPDSVTSIGQSVFSKCSNLTSVNILRGTLLYHTFYECTNLKHVSLGINVSKVDGTAFYDCGDIDVVSLWDVTQIINETYVSGTTIKNAYINISDLGKYIEDTTITASKFPAENRHLFIDGIEIVGNIEIPNGVTFIKGYVFGKCHNLTSVTIPDSVVEIGSGAFYNLTLIQYYDFSTHESVPTLANTNAFYNIPSTCKIIVPDALYDEWIAATNWSTYASYIIKKSDWDASQTTE